MQVSGQPHAPAALPPGNEVPAPNDQEAAWASKQVWTFRRKIDILTNSSVTKYEILKLPSKRCTEVRHTLFL